MSVAWPKYQGLILVLLLCASAVTAQAAVITFTGSLDPALDPNLTAWDQLSGFTAPIAGPTDADRAYNIALRQFTVTVGGTVSFSSFGYGLGGFDAVLSVFEGVGNTAAYIDHSYNQSSPGDFTFNHVLAPGLYTLAISVFDNEPCAPGLCVGATGTLGDGFTNLVNYDPSGSLAYEVTVTTPDVVVPEPGTLGLVAAATGLLFARRYRRRA